MKRLVGMVGLVLLLATAMLAANDLTGQWSGSFNRTMDGERVDDVIHMVLKQSGAEITGTVGPDAGQQWPIQKGKVEGNKVTFEVQTPEPLIRFELTLAEGHLKGEAKAEHEGRSMKGVVDVQRKTE